VKADWRPHRGNTSTGWQGAPHKRASAKELIRASISGHHRHSPTLFQPRSTSSLLTASSLTPMLTVRSPLPRNTSEIIHKSPDLVLRRASLTCVNSTKLPPCQCPPEILASSSLCRHPQRPCNTHRRVASHGVPESKNAGAEQESSSVSTRHQCAVLSSH
jgi:hypothetical protein